MNIDVVHSPWRVALCLAQSCLPLPYTAGLRAAGGAVLFQGAGCVVFGALSSGQCASFFCAVLPRCRVSLMVWGSLPSRVTRVGVQAGLRCTRTAGLR